jgi:hypothetical protein
MPCLRSTQPTVETLKDERAPLDHCQGGPFSQFYEQQNLIFTRNQVIRKDAFEPALFVLVMQQNYGSNPQ